VAAAIVTVKACLDSRAMGVLAVLSLEELDDHKWIRFILEPGRIIRQSAYDLDLA
jgi:hypothetical protein